MKPYVKENITSDETITIKYFTKLLSQSAEAVIFIFLGLSAAVKVKTNDIDWNSSFIGITLAACIFYRSMGVIIQCSILNRFNTKKFSFSDMFVLSFGGLRGAIAFGLVSSISPNIEAKSLFVTTTMVVIFFTVFIQGCSIKPILSLLNVKLENEPDDILKEHTFDYYFGHTMSGIESVAGQKGWNFLRQWYDSLNAKLLKPLLIKNYKKQKHDPSTIIRAYQKITLKEAMDIFKSGQRPMSSMSNLSGQFPPSSTPAVYQLFNGLLNQKLKEDNGNSDDSGSFLSENSIGITLYDSSSNSSSGHYRYI
uniref:Cation/H+ exchanger domain-containing protein n=1 Tax=Panagrolaimus davidi TaxID=227884 RepID=A0A914QXJ9_9BILA